MPAFVDLNGALALVSCVKSKASHACPARDLYTSPWFLGVRDIVESAGVRWLILSSHYGLVEPETTIKPYDFTLYSVGRHERRPWAEKVLPVLLPLAEKHKRVVLFAIAPYREFLVGPLRRLGIDVSIPMEHLRRGEQLAWLANARGGDSQR